MIFSKLSSLNFTGLHKIQRALDGQYPEGFPPQTLLITASLPSLTDHEKSHLSELIRAHQRIIFWCYGDLIWNKNFWESIEADLKGKAVTWVVGSERWKKLASLFIPVKCISVIPHPVTFQLPQKDRLLIRNELGWKQDDKILLYVGRRSQQKNLPLLWRYWKELKLTLPELKLAMVGEWCDYGVPQETAPPRSILNQKIMWEELVQLYPEDLWDYGQMMDQPLAELMLAADSVISLSTFLEEDYGLALREARSIGTPVVATNWGGHADLKDGDSFLIPVAQEGEIDNDLALIAIRRALESKRSQQNYQFPISPTLFELLPFGGFKEATIDLARWKKIMSGFDD
jgi:glycosyltransferase involved in cell wall biosynthesis